MNENLNITPMNSAQVRQQERFDRKGTAVAEKMLRQIRELSHMPETLNPFLETLEGIFSRREDAMRPHGIPDRR